MPAHPADRPSSHDLTTTTARSLPATCSHEDDVTGQPASFSGTYIYGYDSGGDPTLTDAGSCFCSDGKLPSSLGWPE